MSPGLAGVSHFLPIWTPLCEIKNLTVVEIFPGLFSPVTKIGNPPPVNSHPSPAGLTGGKPKGPTSSSLPEPAGECSPLRWSCSPAPSEKIRHSNDGCALNQQIGGFRRGRHEASRVKRFIAIRLIISNSTMRSRREAVSKSRNKSVRYDV